MAPRVDLGSSSAKHRRAVEHLENLNARARAAVHESDPYSASVDLDDETGWARIMLRPESLDLELSVMVGDVVHNLRSALDHAVSALVDLSGGELTTRHQFPIHLEQEKFDASCGSPDEPTGSLAGVLHGFTVIREFQPFQLGEDADQAALAILQRLSNSDKHRALIAFAAPPERYTLRLSHDGAVIDRRKPPHGPMWHPHQAVELERVRFAHPLPTHVEPEVDLDLQLSFIDQAFPPRYPYAIYFQLADLGHMANQVATILERLRSAVDDGS